MRLRLAAFLLIIAACKKGEPAPAPVSLDAAAVAPVTVHDAAPVAPVVTVPDADAWRVYSIADGFVRAPVPPELSTVDIPSDDGTLPATQYTFELARDDVMFAVMVVTSPPDLGKSIDQMLTDGRDGVIEAYSSTIELDVPKTIDGAKARDVTFTGSLPDLGAVRGRMVVLVHAGKLYTALSLQVGSSPFNDPLTDRFIESFHFTPQP